MHCPLNPRYHMHRLQECSATCFSLRKTQNLVCDENGTLSKLREIMCVIKPTKILEKLLDAYSNVQRLPNFVAFVSVKILKPCYSTSGVLITITAMPCNAGVCWLVIADLANCLETFPVVRDIPLIQLFVAENLVTCSSSVAVNTNKTEFFCSRKYERDPKSYDKSLMACNIGCFGVLKKYKKLVDLKPLNKDPHAQ